MNIRFYILRRIALIIPTLIGLSILTFAIARIVPGDPVGLAAGPRATEEIKESLRREFGLDQPLPVQYVNYISGLFQGDWGQSLYTRREVLGDLRTFWPATLELTTAAVIIATLLGVPAGVISAMYRNRLPDHVARVLSLFFVSFPSFWLAMIFQTWFARDLGWFPIGKRLPVLVVPPPSTTGLYLVDSLIQLDFETFAISLRHLFIPALVLSFGAFASITRITRASMVDALEKDFVRMERAIGIPYRVIIFKYVLRNALIATITVISLNFGWLMAGAILIETIFDWPGLGLYAVNASLSLDFQPIMGIAVLYGIVFSVVNILTDIVYGILDPRIRYG
ncbi:MAG: ABC transporter permease [Chloroflexi bacterium]|nr:ABC transporter permease [Chloroflexota bacterium]MCY3581849.1 ABC transporter permease [Chloroflexota bacterium]MCY3716495.1 ABC transporter permease [Chloroflexota bacterium]MDE2651589.1 ABC transporter permease [Chloroflexota bacterium]MXX51901.1 ABC transporter permease [Chloroflexota bacterium]